MASKLFSCIGFAIRLTKRIGCTEAVRSHLSQAMICLKDSADDVAQSVERDAKRRRIINLSACLWVEATIQQREDVIAELQRELNSIELNPLSP